jgi:hypothetical protein
MSSALRRAARVLTPITAAGVTAALGYPAIATAAGLIVFTLTAACWIINSNERTERLTRIILAHQGNPACLATSRQPYNPQAVSPRPYACGRPGAVAAPPDPPSRRRGRAAPSRVQG